MTGKRLPLFVGWDLTYRCNHDCVYCQVRSLDRGEELPTENVCEAIRQFAALGTKRIHFGGGEVLLRPDLAGILKCCAEQGIDAVVLSNGALVKERIAELGYASLIKISFDGPEDVHDLLRGPGSYRSVLESIDVLKKYRKKTAFNVTVSQKNMKHLDFIFELSKQKEVPVKFQLATGLLSGNKNIEGLVLTKEQRRDIFQAIIREKRTNPFIINSYSALEFMRDYPSNKRNKCMACRLYVRVAADGYLYPCLIMKGKVSSAKAFPDASIKELFSGLPEVSCADCLCTSVLELNLINSFRFDSVFNGLRRF